MNAKSTLSVLALAAGFAAQAYAETPTIVNDTFVSSRTRAEVMAELASQRGMANPWADHYDALAGFRSGASRESVRAEFLASRNESKALTGEDSGSTYLAQRRAPVAGDTFMARSATAQ